jgi:asparagine synthase (glutamine-hydrolysing)
MLVVENGKCRDERWYDYKPVPFDPPKNEKVAEDELLELYEAAVERHLLSDVPVGILLSGGVDSALLLALKSTRQRLAGIYRGLWSDISRRRIGGSR